MRLLSRWRSWRYRSHLRRAMPAPWVERVARDLRQRRVGPLLGDTWTRRN